MPTTKRTIKVGRVVSDKMDKTIVVSVERLSRHRLYKRVIRLTTKFKAHDERNEARIGDTVRIEESRPLSATKRWRLVEIVKRAGEGAATCSWPRKPRPPRPSMRGPSGSPRGDRVGAAEAAAAVAASEPSADPATEGAGA